MGFILSPEQTIETGDLTCTLLHSDTNSGSGDGCICMREG